MSAPVELKKPLSIYRGDTLARTFTFGVRDEVTGVITAIDLTPFGTAWTAQLRPNENSEEKIDFQVDTSQKDIGKITIKLTSAQSTTVPSKGVWDIQVVNSGTSPATVKTMLRGSFVLVKDVTRP